MAVRCRSCSARPRVLSAWYSARDSRGAGMKDSRVARHACQPSHRVRSGGGPARRNGTTASRPPLPGLSRSRGLLIVLRQQEHVVLPEACPQAGRRLRGDRDGRLPPAAALGINAVAGLPGPLGPSGPAAQRDDARLARLISAVPDGGAGLSALAACAWVTSRACPVRSAFAIWAGRPANRDACPDQLQQDGQQRSASDLGFSPQAPAFLSRSRTRASPKAGACPPGGRPVQGSSCQACVTGILEEDAAPVAGVAPDDPPALVLSAPAGGGAAAGIQFRAVSYHRPRTSSRAGRCGLCSGLAAARRTGPETGSASRTRPGRTRPRTASWGCGRRRGPSPGRTRPAGGSASHFTDWSARINSLTC